MVCGLVHDIVILCIVAVWQTATHFGYRHYWIEPLLASAGEDIIKGVLPLMLCLADSNTFASQTGTGTTRNVQGGITPS